MEWLLAGVMQLIFGLACIWVGYMMRDMGIGQDDDY